MHNLLLFHLRQQTFKLSQKENANMSEVKFDAL